MKQRLYKDELAAALIRYQRPRATTQTNNRRNGCHYIMAYLRHNYKEVITMLKTNSKQAAENIRQYITDKFSAENYTETPPETFPEIAAFIMNCFHSGKYHLPEDKQFYHGSEITAFLDWCAGLPSVLDTCYYYNRSAVDDLGAVLEETGTEKAKYTESAAQELLTKLIYRELTKEAARNA